MGKKLLAVIVALVCVVAFSACTKNEERAHSSMPLGHPGTEAGMQAQDSAGLPKVERKLVLSKEVRARWKAVRITIQDKDSLKTKEYTIAVGSAQKVPRTDLTIKVIAFVPDFKMNDTEIISRSNQPNNPAAQIVIDEPGKPQWKGWLFGLYPGAHSYQNPKITITLGGGVSR